MKIYLSIDLVKFAKYKLGCVWRPRLLLAVLKEVKYVVLH